MKRDLVFILIALLCGILACSAYGDETTPSEAIPDEFDRVEVNHLFNEYGGHQLDQLIFWDWDRSERAMICQTWAILRNCRQEHPEDIPKFEKYRDECLEIIYKDPIDKQKARQYIKYKGEYIGGPNAPRPYGDGYVTEFTSHGVTRRVYTKSMIRTHTNIDPERADKDEHPHATRRGFTSKEDYHARETTDLQ